MVTRLHEGKGPGRTAPAFFVAAVVILAAPAAALAQTRPLAAPAAPAAPAPQPNTPIPDRNVLLKLLWGIMAATEHANRTGNYSVLRDMGTIQFQSTSNPATLAGAFTPLRAQALDLTDTFLVAPTFDAAPTVTGPNLRMSGRFPLRPTAVAFDIIFQWERGAWRLHGLAIQGRPG